MVRPADAGNGVRRRAANGRELRVAAEGADHLVQEGAAPRQRHEGDEVRYVGKKVAERERIALRAGLVGEAADGLERDHA